MASPGRRSGPPQEVLARVDLPRGDVVLAATESGDVWLIGSRTALTIVADDVVSIPWERVEHVGWDTDTSMLAVTEVAQWGVQRPVHRFPVTETGRLLELVRERVTMSLLLQRRVQVSGCHGFVVVARRPPAGGEIGWFVEYDEAVDPEDAVVRDLVEGALATARSDVGA